MPNRKLTHDEFVEKVESLYPGKFTFLEEYQGRRVPIKTMFNKCGHVQSYTPGNLLSFGRECPICNTRRKTHEQFVADVEKRYPGEYEFLSEYIKSDEPIHVLDLKCGLDWWTTPNNIYSDNVRHPEYVRKMSSDRKSMKPEEFLERFKSIAGDSFSEYEFLDEFKSTTQTINIRHCCGYEYSRYVHSILYENAYKCPKCFPKSCKGVQVGVNDIHTKNPYLESILLDKEDAYKYAQFSHEKTYFVCPICGEHLYKEIANVATNGLSCTRCGTGISFGEKYVINFLRHFNIDFEFQFTPTWSNNRRYDFQFDIKDKMYILEVDGGWHNQDNNLSGVSLEEQRLIDQYKTNIAIENGYDVIRLDYDYGKTHNKYKYIINSFLKNNDIGNLFDYDIDLLNEILQTTKSMETISDKVFRVANLWNSLENKNLRNLKNLIKYNEDGLRKALYKASEIGLISETKDEIIMLNRKTQFTNGVDSRAHYAVCDQTGEIMNHTEAREKYNAYLGKYFGKANYSYTGKLPDGTKLTWHKYEGKVIK